MVTTIDAGLFEDLIERVARGDTQARNELVEQLYPFLLTRIRSRNAIRALPKSVDHVHEVAGRIVKKLSDPTVLTGYVAWRNKSLGADFGKWIGTVVGHEVISYVRQIAGRRPRAKVADEDSRVSTKLLLNEFSTSPLIQEIGFRPPNTAEQQARQLVRFAEQNLPKKQCAALALWLEGATDQEIDAELGLAANEGRKLVRRACATLRRKFGTEDDE